MSKEFHVAITVQGEGDQPDVLHLVEALLNVPSIVANKTVKVRAWPTNQYGAPIGCSYEGEDYDA